VYAKHLTHQKTCFNHRQFDLAAAFAANFLSPSVQCSANGGGINKFSVTIHERVQRMLPPHWLDDVFGSIDRCEDQLIGSSQFKSAMAQAKSAYHDAVEFQKANPKVVGASPAQKARQAFLEVINGN